MQNINIIKMLIPTLILLNCGHKSTNRTDNNVSPDAESTIGTPPCEEALRFGGLFNKPPCISDDLAQEIGTAVFQLAAGTAFAINDQGLALTNYHVAEHCLIKNQDKIPPLTGKPFAFSVPIQCNDFEILAISAHPYTDTKLIGEANNLHFNLLGMELHNADYLVNWSTMADWALVKTEPKSNYLSLEDIPYDKNGLYITSGFTPHQSDTLNFKTRNELIEVKAQVEKQMIGKKLTGTNLVVAKRTLNQIEYLLSKDEFKVYRNHSDNHVWAVGKFNKGGLLYNHQESSPEFELIRAINFPDTIDPESITLDDERIDTWAGAEEYKCTSIANDQKSFILNILDFDHRVPRFDRDLNWRLRNLKETPTINQDDYAEEIALLEACATDIKSIKCINLTNEYKHMLDIFLEERCETIVKFNLEDEKTLDLLAVKEYQEKHLPSEDLIFKLTARPGMSGSPIVSVDSGKVVGIFYGESLPENFLMATPIKKIREELKTLGIEIP